MTSLLSLGPFAAITSSDESARAKFEPQRRGHTKNAWLNRIHMHCVEAALESRSQRRTPTPVMLTSIRPGGSEPRPLRYGSMRLQHESAGTLPGCISGHSSLRPLQLQRAEIRVSRADGTRTYAGNERFGYTSARRCARRSSPASRSAPGRGCRTGSAYGRSPLG